jgi:hypothetical protein
LPLAMLVTDRIGHAAFMKYKTVECLNPWYDKRSTKFVILRIAMIKKHRQLSMEERREIVKAKILLNRGVLRGVRMNHKFPFLR